MTSIVDVSGKYLASEIVVVVWGFRQTLPFFLVTFEGPQHSVEEYPATLPPKRSIITSPFSFSLSEEKWLQGIIRSSSSSSSNGTIGCGTSGSRRSGPAAKVHGSISLALFSFPNWFLGLIEAKLEGLKSPFRPPIYQIEKKAKERKRLGFEERQGMWEKGFRKGRHGVDRIFNWSNAKSINF